MRRKQSEKRVISEDREYGSLQIAKIINKVMLSGKKATAENIVYAALRKAADSTGGNDVLTFLQKVLENSSPKKDVIYRRRGGQTYAVPYETTEEKKFTKAVHFIIDHSRRLSYQKGKKFVDALTEILVDTFNSTGPVITAKDSLQKLAADQAAFANLRAA